MIKQALGIIKRYLLACTSLTVGIGITAYLALTHLDYIGVGIIIIIASIIFMLFKHMEY